MLAQLGNCCDQSCCVNDSVCCNTQIIATTGIPTIQVIWTDTTTFVINGTIVVENSGPTTGPSVDLLVNGVIVLTVAPGGCESITVNDLNTIAVAPTALTGTAGVISPVKVAFSLNYKF